MTARLAPGDGIAVIGKRFVALITADGDQLARALEPAIEDPTAAAEQIVEALTSLGTRPLPSFAIAVRADAGWSFFVRGELEIACAAGGDVERYSAPRARSWSETYRRDADTIALHATDCGDCGYWIERGIVTASCVEVTAEHFETGDGGPTEARVETQPASDAGEESVVTSGAPATVDIAPADHVETAVAVGPDKDAIGVDDGGMRLDDDAAVDASADLDDADAAPNLTDSAPADASTGLADDELTSSYFSHLIDETRYRDVEQAAVRDGESEVAAVEPDGGDPEPAEEPGTAEPAERSDLHITRAFEEEARAAAERLDEANPVETIASENDAAGSWRPPDLIESVPGLIPPAGDHDGLTVSIPLTRLAVDGVHKGKTVQAVHCPNMHPNPPHASDCRVCATPITDHTIATISRPSLGELRTSANDTYPVDRPMIIGRKPETYAGGDVDGEAPRLVTVADADQLVSKVHLELRLEDWEVVVTDLQSTNNTFVTLPGQPIVQLRPGEPMQIVPGTRVELAGRVTVTYDLGGGTR